MGVFSSVVSGVQYGVTASITCRKLVVMKFAAQLSGVQVRLWNENLRLIARLWLRHAYWFYNGFDLLSSTFVAGCDL